MRRTSLYFVLIALLLAGSPVFGQSDPAYAKILGLRAHLDDGGWSIVEQGAAYGVTTDEWSEDRSASDFRVALVLANGEKLADFGIWNPRHPIVEGSPFGEADHGEVDLIIALQIDLRYVDIIDPDTGEQLLRADFAQDIVDLCNSPDAAGDPDCPTLDLDNDGVEQGGDSCPLDPDNDADGDGICGDEDNCPDDSNVDQVDGDGDGVGDDCDNCLGDANGGQEDTDGDGRGDACDDDDDDDGRGDGEDNCPQDANPGQEDDDGDGAGNACDNCQGLPNDSQADADGDGVGNACDNCVDDANGGQEDADGDGSGDACDDCPDDPLENRDDDFVCGESDPCPDDYSVTGHLDADDDGVGDECDLCPDDADPNQHDTDGDGLGNACDDDDDGDGTPDFQDPDADGDGVDDDGMTDMPDNCPTVPNPDQSDFDADGEGDACDLDDGLVTGVRLSKEIDGTGVDVVVIRWNVESDATGYNVYQGLLSTLDGTDYGSCIRSNLQTDYATLPEPVPVGDGHHFLVTDERSGGEGTLGHDSTGTERPNLNPCP